MAQLHFKLEKKVTRAAKLKNRMKAVKPVLSSLGWDTCKNILLKHFPEYDTFDSVVTVKNVWDMKGSDTKLTEIFEDIAKGFFTL